MTFPRETSTEMTEEEIESLESGDDVREYQSRYQHTPADLTVIVPYPTLMAAGGSLKAVGVRKDSPEIVATAQDRSTVSVCRSSAASRRGRSSTTPATP